MHHIFFKKFRRVVLLREFTEFVTFIIFDFVLAFFVVILAFIRLQFIAPVQRGIGVLLRGHVLRTIGIMHVVANAVSRAMRHDGIAVFFKPFIDCIEFAYVLHGE